MGSSGAPQEVSGSVMIAPSSSQRDVAVLLRRVRVALGPRELERGTEARAGVPGLDHLVDVAPLGRHVRMRELLAVLGRLLVAEGRRLCRLLELASIED